MLEEFKKFAFMGTSSIRIGVIIGAPRAIVKSLVDDIISRWSLIVPGDKGYEGWVLHVGDRAFYGKFLAVVNFLIVAFVLYIFIVKFLAGS